MDVVMDRGYGVPSWMAGHGYGQELARAWSARTEGVSECRLGRVVLCFLGGGIQLTMRVWSL